MWYAVFLCNALLAFIFSSFWRAPSGQTRHHGMLRDGSYNTSILCLGATLLAVTGQNDARHRLDPPYPDYPVQAWGWVATPLNPTRTGHSFVLATDSIVSPGWMDRSERDVVVYVGSRVAGRRPLPGTRIALAGTLERFPRARNPGEHDYGVTLDVLGISGVLRGTSWVIDTTVSIGPLQSVVGSIQDRLYRWIDALHPGEHGSFVKGIILGYRADLPEDLKEAFMLTGTVHILAVSGSNVALIALIVMVCSGFLRVGRVIRVGLTIAGMLFYMMVTGGGPSITRATIMGITVVLLTFLPRRGDVIQSLGVSATILLLLDPRNLFDAGFLLSFASVIWIVTGNDALQRFIRRMPEEFRESPGVRSALQLCGVSLLAQLGTIPVSALFFGQISLISVFANLLVVPLSAIVLLLGVAELSFYGMLPVLASPYAAANGLVIDVLLGFVRLVSQVSFASVEIHLGGLAEAVLLYCVFVAVVWWSITRVRNTAILAGVLCLNLMVWPAALRPPGGSFEWIAVDVGQGDAHIVRTPEGRTMLIDAAPQERTAERTLLPVLEHLGVDEIDLLVISHPHWDHIAGLGVLLDHVPVRTLVLTDSVSLREDVLESIDAKGILVLRARTGDVLPFGSGVRCYVLHPGIVRPWEGWNNNSLVLSVRYGSTGVLFTGDLEEEGEEVVVARYGDFLRSDLLKAGHHGSSTSTSPVLLGAVQPADAIVSVGWRNRFGHPSPEREALLRDRDVGIHKTSEQGAQWWRSDGYVWDHASWTLH